MSDPARLRPLAEREPAAEQRKFAAILRQMYVALVQEGFTSAEAMQIIGTTIAAEMGKK